MAAAEAVKGLHAEATCPVCLDYFEDPVTTDCGHSFCRACLTHCHRNSGPRAPCPVCKATLQKGSFRPNRHLANIVEHIKKLEEGKRAEGKWGICETHEESLKLFCKDDEALICVVCDKSKGHQDHRVLPLEEAAQEYKAVLDVEKQKTQSIFSQMQTFLQEKEHARLAVLEDLQNKTKKWQVQNVVQFTEDVFSLDHLISEMEENCQLSASEFLQDIGSTMSRYEKKPERTAAEFAPGLEERLRICCQKNSALEGVIGVYKEFLEKAMDKVNVTLDPDTAHPELLLSEDLKSMSLGDRKQDLPDNPERFNCISCVLGSEGFTSGRHWWEVEVKTKVEVAGRTWWWNVGVARESVMRKGYFRKIPDEGVWAVGRPFRNILCHLLGFASSSVTRLQLKHNLRKIRVSLRYEEGLVEFFDADTNDAIFSFPSASFSGEKIRPFFWVGEYGVSLNCSV
ncbi:zinc finger protein RFP-like isoform X2 [Paroedura picta]|uniref:zinc finger protein RFP-like isoform X2 n=1 Tax=Paroedura picta TaxID=143630 RepID=UPI0040579B23